MCLQISKKTSFYVGQVIEKHHFNAFSLILSFSMVYFCSKTEISLYSFIQTQILTQYSLFVMPQSGSRAGSWLVFEPVLRTGLILSCAVTSLWPSLPLLQFILTKRCKDQRSSSFPQQTDVLVTQSYVTNAFERWYRVYKRCFTMNLQAPAEVKTAKRVNKVGAKMTQTPLYES